MLAVLLPPHTVLAARANLYSGEAVVEDQSTREQQRAMPLALQQVLQKITGLNQFGEYPDVAPALQSARSLAITFYYRNKKITLPDGEPAEELYLVVDFSRPGVDRLVQGLALPLWEPERHPLTVWLLVDDGASRRIMPIELEYAWEKLASIAADRGLPLIRPEPDEAGDYPVDAQLLWGGYTEELDAEGPVDALVIAARREGPEWNVRMNLDYKSDVLSWRNRDIDILVALEEGMNTAIGEIVAKNTIAAADQGQGSYDLSVVGLGSANRYAECIGYLDGLSVVEGVDVRSASAGKVQFKLTLNALPDYLLRALEADGVLTATGEPGEYALQP